MRHLVRVVEIIVGLFDIVHRHPRVGVLWRRWLVRAVALDIVAPVIQRMRTVCALHVLRRLLRVGRHPTHRLARLELARLRRKERLLLLRNIATGHVVARERRVLVLARVLCVVVHERAVTAHPRREGRRLARMDLCGSLLRQLPIRVDHDGWRGALVVANGRRNVAHRRALGSMEKVRVSRAAHSNARRLHATVRPCTLAVRAALQ